MPEHQQTQQSTESKTTSQRQATPRIQAPSSHPMAIIQRARMNPKSLTPADILQLQRTIGNRAVGRLLSEIRSSSMAQKVPVQRQKLDEEETCPSCVQRQETPEEEENSLQGVFESKFEQTACPSCIQRKELEEEEPLQTKSENNTGMPDNLKAGVESLSGIDMSDVRVHYNSSKPAEVGALAYTQGTNIHVAPGQERYLPHEAWHVVQQAQGRVRPTMQMKDAAVNDDKGLEKEADVMGARTAQRNLSIKTKFSSFVSASPNTPFQMKKCPKCGAENEDLNGKCKKCGKPFVKPLPETHLKAKEAKGVMKHGRLLRGTYDRCQRFVESRVPQHGKRLGTRAFEKAETEKKIAELELGSGPVRISSGPPTKYGGRSIYNGSRASLRFTEETEGIVYNRYSNRMNNGRKEYDVNGTWLPRKNDAGGGDHTSIDHIKDWASISAELDTADIEFEGFFWRVVYLDDALKLYNDADDPNRGNLRLMAQSANSSRGGQKGVDNIGPKKLRPVAEEEPMDIEDSE